MESLRWNLRYTDFPTEFQGDRVRYSAAWRSTSRPTVLPPVKRFIKTLCKQGLVFLTAASDHTDIFRRVSLFYNHFHYSTRSWCVGTWFDDDGIAGGQCVNQRFQCQEYRIIPGLMIRTVPYGVGTETSCGELCQWVGTRFSRVSLWICFSIQVSSERVSPISHI